MDRRYKDYFIVTFKRHYDYYSWGSGFQTDAFSMTRIYWERFGIYPVPIKIHWRSIRNIPYALVSVDKELSETAVGIFKNTYGVDRVIPYTEQKERDWDMWQKILRLPENDYWVKCKIQKCMQQDLFIDWEV